MSSSRKDLILSWANYNDKINAAFRRYLDKQIFCNVTLSAEGGTVKCHQEILSACSGWFERVLCSVDSYHQHPIIVLKDVKFKELQYIIRFIYSGQVVVPHQDIASFIKTAEILEIKELIDSESPAAKKQDEIYKTPPNPTNQEELTVTTSPSLKPMHLNRPKASNPLMKAYEANKRKPDHHHSPKSPESKKHHRSYEANALVVDNRDLLSPELSMQPVSSSQYDNNYDFGPDHIAVPGSGIEDCGPFKKIWSYRYLCYNLGKEILCLLCFCRFTQFKKFNLDRHMRNKHPHLYYIDDEVKKRVLDMYVARYEENVTPGMIASVPSQGNEQMAAGILQVGPIQLDALLGEAGWEAGGAGPLHPMMEGDDLLECQLGETEDEAVTLVKQERGQMGHY